MNSSTYHVKVYMTDGEKIRQLWGSNNEEMLAHFKEKYQGVLQGMNEAFGLTSPPKMENVLEDFFRGEVSCLELTETYGYVYELFVYEFGKVFNFEDDLEGLRLEYLDEIDGEVSAFVEIPLPESEFPHFLSIPNKQIEERKKEFLENLPEEHSDEDKALLKAQLEFVFHETKQAGLDIVFFNY